MPNAETFFSNGVLFVEGPGDRAFFQTILRRLRQLKDSSALNKLVVQDIGGKTRFAPWINLLKAYGNKSDRPIEWLSLFDCDAAESGEGKRSIFETLRTSSSTVGKNLEKAVLEFGDFPHASDNNDERVELGVQMNRELEKERCRILSVDLEWMMFKNEQEAEMLAWIESQKKLLELENLDLERKDRDIQKIARYWGSKVGTGKSKKKPKKDPYLRGKLAAILPFEFLSKEAEEVLKLSMALVTSPESAEAIWESAVKENPSLN